MQSRLHNIQIYNTYVHPCCRTVGELRPQHPLSKISQQPFLCYHVHRKPSNWWWHYLIACLIYFLGPEVKILSESRSCVIVQWIEVGGIINFCCYIGPSCWVWRPRLDIGLPAVQSLGLEGFFFLFWPFSVTCYLSWGFSSKVSSCT